VTCCRRGTDVRVLCGKQAHHVPVACLWVWVCNRSLLRLGVVTRGVAHCEQRSAWACDTRCAATCMQVCRRAVAVPGHGACLPCKCVSHTHTHTHTLKAALAYKRCLTPGLCTATPAGAAAARNTPTARPRHGPAARSAPRHPVPSPAPAPALAQPTHAHTMWPAASRTRSYLCATNPHSLQQVMRPSAHAHTHTHARARRVRGS
jgi:hypothetical protein